MTRRLRLILMSSLIATTACARPSGETARTGGFQAEPCGAPAPAKPGKSIEPTTIDMTGPAQGVPHGATTASGREIAWARKARVWRGSNPRPGWRKIISTGMIYASKDRPHSPGVRVQVRDIKLFVKPRSTGRWCLLDAQEKPGGAFYAENFANDYNEKAVIRSEPSGGLSARMKRGRNYHFFGETVLLPDGPMDGVFVQYEARVVTDKDAKRHDLERASYVGATSADFWISSKDAKPMDGWRNEDLAISRFKKLTKSWRFFTMNTNGGPALAPAP